MGGFYRYVCMLSLVIVVPVWYVKMCVLLVPHIKQCVCKKSVSYGRFKAIPNIMV